jgi:HK97 family phage portal protein
MGVLQSIKNIFITSDDQVRSSDTNLLQGPPPPAPLPLPNKATDQTRAANLSNLSINDLAQVIPTSINGNGSLQVAAVYASMKVITDTVASVARNLYESKGESRYKSTNNPTLPLLDRINPYLSFADFVYVFLKEKWIKGNSYWRIERDYYGTATVIHYRMQGGIIPYVDNNELFYYDTVTKEVLDPMDVLHFKDLTCTTNPYVGKSRIDNFAKSIGKLQATDDLQNKFSTSGANLGGVVVYPADTNIDDDDILRQEKNFHKNHGGTSNAGKWSFFSGGPDVKQFNTSMTFSDAQVIAMQHMSIEDICRMMSVPPMKIAHLVKATYNNIEHLNLDFMQGAILPEVTQLENEWDYKILGQYKNTRLKLEIDSLLRADTMSTIRAIKEAISTGLMSPNEGRALLNRNPVPGGDVHFFPANNMAPLTSIKAQKNE